MKSQSHFASCANEGVISLWLSFNSYRGMLIHVIHRLGLKLLSVSGEGLHIPISILIFFRSLFHLLQYCFCFWFVFLAERHVGSWLPNQGSNPHPLHWKAKSNHWTTKKAHSSVILKHRGAEQNMPYPPSFSLLDKSVESKVHVFSAFNFSCFHHSY